MKQTLRITTAALFTVATLLTTACNTVEGVGKDIGSAGKTIEKTGQKR